MKKLALGILIFLLLAFGGYYYMSHFYGVKDYSASKADFSLTSSVLKSDFTSNEAVSTAKYVNKTVEVSGTVTENTGVNINFDGVSCKMKTPDNSAKVGSTIKVKGRLVGYDSLIEEVQLDECSVQK